MNKVKSIWIIASLLAAILVGCSGTGPNAGNPLTPSGTGITAASSPETARSQTHLWGYYDVRIDLDSKTVTATDNRQAMFTANVVSFLNGKPPKMGFTINDTPTTADYVDVDIDVSLTHPFPGLTQYNGYDVRGVFMGDGASTLYYNPELIYPILGMDQFMLPDPDDGIGGPDGYTRWFNKPEFSTGGAPLLSYTQGGMATPGFNGSATLCPYRYYADNLGPGDDLFEWLQANGVGHGVFSAGSTNTRNYYLRFPKAKNVVYGYAVLANWTGPEPENHPSNAPEAVACSVVDNSTVYFKDPSTKGGDIIMDVSIWNWNDEASAGVMEDYTIFIESTVLNSVHQFQTAEMTPIGGGEHYSTYHVDIPSDNINDPLGNESWVTVQEAGADYTNEFGVSNLADTDPLAAFFRYDLDVKSEPPIGNLVCDVQFTPQTPCGDWGILYQFDASGSYVIGGGTLTYEWDFNDDGIFGDPYEMGTADKPLKLANQNYKGDVCVRVSYAGVSKVCCVPVDIKAFRSKNIPLRPGAQAYDIAVDHADGDLLVLYSDGQVWRYLISDHYQFASAGNNPLFTTAAGCNHMDIPPNSYVLVGGNNDKSISYASCYRPTGQLTSTLSAPNGVYEVSGCTSHTSGYDWYNADFLLSGWFDLSYDLWFNRWFADLEYQSGANGNLFHNQSGPNGIDANVLKGAEVPNTGDNIYILEGDPECSVEARYIPGFGNTAVRWGGVKSDGMEGFNDPQDITRDPDNNFYILDKLTTGPAIKKYTSTGTPIGEPFGGWGIAGDPLKIEDSDYIGACDHLLFVLSAGAGPTADMVSIFIPSEIP